MGYVRTPHNGGLSQNKRSFRGCTGQCYEAGGGSQKRQQIGDVRYCWPHMFKLRYA